jgi:putative ABC transport system permease protein
MHLEKWIYGLPFRLRSLFSRQRVEQELGEELQYHVEQLTEAHLASGMKPEEARLAAVRAMQGIEQKKEECRDVRGVAWLENLLRDLHYAFRMLRRSPVFTAVAILSLALGIGANTAIFGLINSLLLRPLPVPQPDRLRVLYLNRGPSPPQFAITYPLFDALKDHNPVFKALFAWNNHQFQMKSGAEMVHVDGSLASGDYFSALGVAPALGRAFTAADDHATGGKDGPVAVISDQFWARQFQRSPSALGSAMTLDGIGFTVIGVMPPGFFGAEMDARPNIWVPLQLASRIEDPRCAASRSCWWLVAMGRLKDGVSAPQAEAELKIASPGVLKEALPDWGAAGQKRFLSWSFSSSSGEQGWSFLRVAFTNPLVILMTLVGLVLVIACANMANLLMARAAARQREIGVRLAMGAGRWRVVRQLLTESALLSVLGALAGSLFALWLSRILAAFLKAGGAAGPNRAIELDLHPDLRVALFTLVVAIGTGMLFGLAPALRATRTSIGSSLKESANNLRGRNRASLGRVTLALQAAFSVLLVAAAGLFAGSLYQLLALKLGFNPGNVVIISLDTDKRPEKGVALSNLYARVLERVNATPGVKAASLMLVTPLSNGGWDDGISIPGHPELPEQERDTYINAVGPRFFDTMEIPLLSGRQFTNADGSSSEKVGIINQLAAKRFFPRENPLGARISVEGSTLRIVGVTGDIKYLNMRNPAPPELYIPYTQRPDGFRSLTFAVRSDLSAGSFYPAFRAALRSVAPDVPIAHMGTMEQQAADSVGRERLMASLSVFFGLLALLLTAIGLHGILAYAVTRRTSEIGIRMALGAQRRSVVWLVVSETAGYVGAGIAVGVAAVLGLSKLAADLLYGIRPNDPGNLVLAVVALASVAIVAAAAPALRAARLDPTRALREE